MEVVPVHADESYAMEVNHPLSLADHTMHAVGYTAAHKFFASLYIFVQHPCFLPWSVLRSLPVGSLLPDQGSVVMRPIKILGNRLAQGVIFSEGQDAKPVVEPNDAGCLCWLSASLDLATSPLASVVCTARLRSVAALRCPQEKLLHGMLSPADSTLATLMLQD